VAEPAAPANWSLATWEGSRRNQIRHWLLLSVRERLQAIEELAQVARHLEGRRISRKRRD
jgi:hypothetical protein